METEHSSRDGDSDRDEAPIQATAILLVVCFAMYLATAGVATVISPNPAAAAPEGSVAPASAEPASDPPIPAGQLPKRDWVDQDPERLDNPRECSPSAAIESKCIYG